jgi:hypothetical protein
MKKKILFSGSAWVHFACVHPVYRRLADDPRIEFWLTGGFKKGEDSEEAAYVLDGFYDPFDVDRSRVIPVEKAAEMDVDVLVAAHKSPAKPRSMAKSVQVFHGVSFKNLGVREKYLKFDHLCLAGPYHGEAYGSAGFVREPGQCLITGVPKMDALVSGTLDRTRSCAATASIRAVRRSSTRRPDRSSTRWRRWAARHRGDPARRPVEPAHQAARSSEEHRHRLGARDPRMESDRVRLVTDRRRRPVSPRADLLLTDASSVSVEYSLLDRPIVFLDVPSCSRTWSIAAARSISTRTAARRAS